MTVGELIEKLSLLDANLPVLTFDIDWMEVVGTDQGVFVDTPAVFLYTEKEDD